MPKSIALEVKTATCSDTQPAVEGPRYALTIMQVPSTFSVECLLNSANGNISKRNDMLVSFPARLILSTLSRIQSDDICHAPATKRKLSLALLFAGNP